MNAYESVLAEAIRLGDDDRRRLIDALSESLAEDEPPPLDDAWRSEIARRVAEIESGSVVGTPLEEVLHRLERRLP